MLLQALDHTLRPSRLACSPVPPFKWPQIFVIGGVGVGKSSVVKRLLVGGVEVPVGVDCVTRRPTQFVPPTMEAESDSETVTATLVSQHSAEALQVPCPSAPTVIWDFPGLTQMPRPGQPDNIHQLVQDGIRQRYRPGDLLIAVVAGSEDFANAEVINLAKELDPMGGHTVFVVTKLDLSSSGVAANIDGGFGGVFGEPRAVVCVRNCGFAEQDQDADALERAFFSTNQAAAAITGKWGISALAQEITAIVAEQARAHYVHHQQSLERTLAALKAKHLRLSQPGYPVFLLTRYLGHLEGVLEGRWSAEAAAIGYAFGYELPAALEAIEPVTGIPARELHILFKNSKVGAQQEGQ